MANVSWKFRRIENKQIKTVHNDSRGQNWHKTTYFCVEAVNSKRKITGKLGRLRGTNSRLPYGVNVNLNLSINVVSRVSSFRTDELVEILFLKRDGFDISLYQAP